MSKVLEYGIGGNGAVRRNWLAIVSVVMVGVGFVHGAVWYHLAHESGKNEMLVRAVWVVMIFNAIGGLLGVTGLLRRGRACAIAGILGNGLVGVFWFYQIAMLA